VFDHRLQEVAGTAPGLVRATLEAREHLALGADEGTALPRPRPLLAVLALTLIADGDGPHDVERAGGLLAVAARLGDTREETEAQRGLLAEARRHGEVAGEKRGEVFNDRHGINLSMRRLRVGETGQVRTCVHPTNRGPKGSRTTKDTRRHPHLTNHGTGGNQGATEGGSTL